MTGMEAVGVGLVGAGAYGVFCLDAFHDMPEVQVVAVADVDRARAEAAAAKYQAAAYASLEDMLDNPRVEIVALNTPPFLHAPQAVAAARAGRHIFAEKPLAMTLDEARQVLETVEQQGVRLTIDYVMRRNPFWEAAANLRRDGVLGRLLHMDLINHAAGLNLPPDHWFWDVSKSGGIWVEHGVHFFDAFAWVSGERGEIAGAQALARNDGAIDRVEAIARFGEAAAHFYHGFTHSGKTEQTTVKLAFERGYVTLREWVPTSIEIYAPLEADALTDYLPGEVVPQPQAEQADQDALRRYLSRAPEGKTALYRTCIQAGMRDLALAIRDPQRQLGVTGQHGYDSLRLALAATSA